MDVSIIIPAYNEGDRLPRLLHDLRRQRGVDPEVIVADANSTDNTRAAAGSCGATVVDGGLPAAGRNAGAARARGGVLVFLDADVRVPRTFLQHALTEMQEKNAVVATCVAKPMSRLVADRLIHTVANLFIRINQDRDPHAPGYCILVRREVFDAVGGFNEEIRVAEDHDFVSRASRHGRFRLLDSTTAGKALRKLERGLIRAEQETRRMEDQLWSPSASAELRDRAHAFFDEIGEKLRAAGRAVLRPGPDGAGDADKK